MALFLEGAAQGSQAAAEPLLVALRIAGGLRLDQSLQVAFYRGVFSSTGGASAPRLAHSVGRSVREVGGQFLLTPADRLLVQASDLCQEVHAAVAEAVGFEGDVPATLRFIEAREEPIDLSVSLLVGMRLALATVITQATDELPA